MNFQKALDHHYPNALFEEKFVTESFALLEGYGFTGENTLACVSVCRDEITRSLVDAIQSQWGEAFNFSSLAGMIFAGKTGMGAALAHAPISSDDGRERYIFFVMPHIGIDEEGAIGKCTRHGRPGKSTACGALVAFQGELQSGEVDLAFDPADPEQSMLKSRLSTMLEGNESDLINLTNRTHDAIVDDLEHLIKLSIDTNKADYAVFSGIQIHGPEGKQLIFPNKKYAVVDGELKTF